MRRSICEPGYACRGLSFDFAEATLSIVCNLNHHLCMRELPKHDVDFDFAEAMLFTICNPSDHLVCEDRVQKLVWEPLASPASIDKHSSDTIEVYGLR